MIHIKMWGEENLSRVKGSITVLLLYMAIIPLLTFAWTQSSYLYANNAGTIISFADYFILANEPSIFFLSIVMISALLCISFNKNDFRINSIVRQTKLQNIWKKQAAVSLFVAFIVAIYLQIIAAIIGAFNYTVSINFYEKRSLFGFANYGNVLIGASLVKVIVFSFLSCFATLLVFNILYMLMKWIFNYDIACFVVIILAGMVDIFGGVGIGSIVGVGYMNWLPYRPATFLFPAAIVVALYVVGLNYSKRKEFFHAK